MSKFFKILKKRGRELEVYPDGRVLCRAYTTPKGRRCGEYWMKPRVTSVGYEQVSLTTEGKRTWYLIHRLVAEAFLGDYSEDLTTDHINGDRRDNRMENLRMVTHSQNLKGYQKKQGGQSIYRGVVRTQPSVRKRMSKEWNAQNQWLAVCNRKHVGYYQTELEAAIAWNIEALKQGYSREALNVITNGDE